MELQFVKRSVLDYTQKKKKWVAMLLGLGFSSYAVYRVYNFPSIAQRRKRISKLLGCFISVAEVVSDSAETIGVISRELKDFLQSDSDKIPNSLKQISKLTSSSEFSESVISLTQALTLGIMSGYDKSSSRNETDSSFLDQVFDKLTTPAGSGFVSVVVGSFARNLVMGFYQSGNSSLEIDSNSITDWVDIVCSNKCKELIGDCIQLFVSTAVAVYLDKTMHINTYDEFFSGLTNPKHEKKVSDVLVSVCNGAIQTLVKTSHEVLTNPDSETNSNLAISEKKQSSEEETFSSSTESTEDGGWVGKVSSTLAVPRNRRLVLDLSGRITFETVRSFLEFLVEKIYDGIRKCVDFVGETVVESGIRVVRYVTAKSSAIVTVCLTLCLHILDGGWVMLPA
ncbi:protein PHLOEM PROTEIN 2-LIKE A10-like [Mercurialis annua]|uniref:protein PHLOEM PROTEIN 2-LIKE A10-like n=1 Tax=Mercurialis annua TaxID=3986 RepID=UPI00215E05A7|nr:protein PHLOEM PROTEIN 2-LIKE A10-like [Mercurialis annua]